VNIIYFVANSPAWQIAEGQDLSCGINQTYKSYKVYWETCLYILALW